MLRGLWSNLGLACAPYILTPELSLQSLKLYLDKNKSYRYKILPLKPQHFGFSSKCLIKEWLFKKSILFKQELKEPGECLSLAGALNQPTCGEPLKGHCSLDPWHHTSANLQYTDAKYVPLNTSREVLKLSVQTAQSTQPQGGEGKQS